MSAYFRHLYRLYRPSAGWIALALFCITCSSLILTLVIGMTRVLVAGDQRLRDPDSLTIISLSPKTRDGSLPVSPALYNLWSGGAKTFESIAAETNEYFVLPVKLSPQGGDEQVNVGVVTPNYFTALGINAKWGRAFATDEASNIAEVVISESVWRREFAADVGVLGKTIWVNRKPYNVVGVEPDSYPVGVQLWLDRPLEVSQILDTSLKMTYYFNVWGRLRQGITKQEAAAELEALSPESLNGLGQPATVTVRTTAEFLIRRHATAARLVALSAVAIFLIGCGNASMILLLRALSRQRDIALRYVLGATRVRIISLALGEALGLALLVVLLVLGFLPAAVRGFLAFLPPEIAVRGLPVDVSLLSICIGVSAICVLLPNLMSLAVLFRPNYGELVRDDPGSVTAKDSNLKARAFLLAAQLAITVAVSVVALSLLKSALLITRSHLGLNPHNCVVIEETLSGERLNNQASQVRYLQDVLPRLGQVHGVATVGAINFLPLGGGRYSVVVETPGSPDSGAAAMIPADEAAVIGDYFSAVGTPLLRGRAFGWSDTALSEAVAIVDEVLARKIADGNDALGKLLTIEGVTRKIVGIAGIAEFRGLDTNFVPLIYVPLSQSHFAFPFVSIVARVDNPSNPMVRTLQAVVSKTPDSGTIKSAESLQDILAAALQLQTTALRITGILAGIGFALSLIGMSAAIAYTVSRRQHEIGIRLALGATVSAIGKTILRSALAPAFVGLLLGLILANWTSRQIGALLYGVHAFDAGIYIAVSLLLLAAVAGTVVSQLRGLITKRIPALLRAR